MTGAMLLAGIDFSCNPSRRKPITVATGRLDGPWLVVDDVSELRRLQRIRTEFIDNLSHELRTPLTTVSLLAETLARDAEPAIQDLSNVVRKRGADNDLVELLRRQPAVDAIARGATPPLPSWQPAYGEPHDTLQRMPMTSPSALPACAEPSAVATPVATFRGAVAPTFLPLAS